MLLPPEVDVLIPTLGFMPVAVMITDRSGLVVYANFCCFELTGYSDDEIVGQDAGMLGSEDSVDRLHNLLRHVLASGESWKGEWGGRRKNGEGYGVALTITPIRDRLDSITHALWTLPRMAAHSLAEEAQEEREALYRAAFESSRDALFVADAQTGMLVDANPAAQRLIGRTLEEVRKLHQSQLHPPEDAQLARTTFERDLRVPGVSVHTVVRSDGKHIPVEVVSTRIRDMIGRRLLLGAYRDISEESRAKDELKATLSNYRLLIEQADDGIFLTNSDGRFVVANSGICRMLGYTEDEMLRLNVLDTYRHEEQRLGRARLALIKSGQSVRFERSMRRKDGTALQVEASASRLEDGRLQAIVRDITERNRAEENYRTLFREMLDGFALHEIICDDEGRPIDYRFLAVNPAFERMTGLKAEDTLGKTVLAVLPGTEQHWIETYGSVALTGAPAFFENYHAELNKYFEVTAFRPAPNQFACIFADITARRTAEVALEQSHHLLSTFSRLVPGVIYQYRLYPDGRSAFPYSSSGMEDIYEVTPEEVREDATPVFGRLHPDDYDKVAGSIQESARTLDAFYCEFRVILPRQGLRWRWSQAHPERMEDGSTLWHGIISDITERKKAEEALRESEGRLQYLIASSPVVIYTCEAEGDYAATFVSKNIRALFGYEPQAFLDDPRFWIERIHPEDAPQVLLELSRLFERGRQSQDYRFLHQDGTYRWVRDESVLICNSEGRVTEILGSRADITESKLGEEQLRSANQRLELAQAAAKAGAWDWVIDSGLLKWASELFTLFGLNPEKTIASFEAWDSAMHPDDREIAHLALRRALEERSDLESEYRVVLPDGRVRWISALGRATYDDSGRPLRMSGICFDVSDRKEAEEEKARLQAQLQQAQKMESIGRLAGGVAHDFNNLLTVINGHSEMILAGLSEGDPVRASLSEILKAGERAAALTRQLLAYSRKQVLQPSKFSLNRVVTEMLPMLQRLMGEDVEVRADLQASAGVVLADTHQVEQVLMNLAVNSRDAMPGGGKLLIRTSDVTFDESFVQAHPEARVGRFVMLAVSDTGVGMDEETRRKIFEPFFTTKGVGEGTGLGLSTVQGIVMQSGGYIAVYSEPSHGTTFMIYLPEVAAAQIISEVPVVTPMLGGTETVLVVEDQPEVLNYAVNALNAYGYRVVSAAGVREALRVFEQERGCIDLVLTDVVMPDGSGRELADKLKKLHPGIKVLFMSGYTDDAIVHHGVLQDGAEFIQKPFGLRQLATKVRMVLGK